LGLVIFKGRAFFIGSSQMTFGTWFVNKTNAPIYRLCPFGMEGKRYGIKKLVANATNVVATYMQILHGTYAILT
jgi:hypothetical protein